jgi:hypothetical protein
MEINNMIGYRKGRLVVLEEIKKKTNARRYLCKCDCGIEIELDAYRLKDNNKTDRCKFCIYNEIRYSYDEVKTEVEKLGYRLISQTYHNANEYLDIQCKCGQICKKKFSSFRKSPDCRKCGYKKRNQRGDKNPMWNPNRQFVNNNKKYRTACKNLLRRSIAGTIKDGLTYELLGYGPQELKDYLENHSNWKKLQNKKWAIDHIFPIKAFMEYQIYDLKMINCLDNLQPLEFNINAAKKDKYDQIEFEKFLRNKGIME